MFNDQENTEIYTSEDTLSLHDALPIEKDETADEEEEVASDSGEDIVDGEGSGGGPEGDDSDDDATTSDRPDKVKGKPAEEEGEVALPDFADGTTTKILDDTDVSDSIDDIESDMLRIAKTLRTEKAVADVNEEIIDRKSTRLTSSHIQKSRMPSSA